MSRLPCHSIFRQNGDRGLEAAGPDRCDECLLLQAAGLSLVSAGGIGLRCRAACAVNRSNAYASIYKVPCRQQLWAC